MEARPRFRSEHGRPALAAIDQVLADRPQKNSHDFSQALERLNAFRNDMIRHQRSVEPDARDLDQRHRLNGVISVIVGGEYPVGPLPWEAVEKARAAFAELLDEVEAD